MGDRHTTFESSISDTNCLELYVGNSELVRKVIAIMVRLICPGFESLGIQIPPFEVRAGEILRLVFPPRAPLCKLFEAPHLIERNLHFKSDDDARVGRLAFMPWIYPRRRWRNWFRCDTALQWLAENSDLSRASAADTIQHVGVNPHELLWFLAGSPRGLLGLLSILHQGADGIVFHTMGVPPLTVDHLLRTAFAELGKRAGVYCQTHVFRQGRTILEEYEFPFSETVYVTDCAASSTRRIAG